MAVENLITEHIDIWTSAIKTKSTSGRGSSKKLELYGVKKLRELILELAVRGKLVPQDPNDEPASVLLERIAAEKAELVKEKIIRKSKSLPVVSKKEQPFVLPKGWVWERLGNIGIGATGKTPSTKQSIFFEGSIPFIGPGQINQNGEILVPEKFLSCEGLLNSTEAIEGDILMVCIGGSIGKAAIARQTVGFNQQINAIRALQMPSAYLYTSLSTDSFLQELLKKATGSATPIINRRKWEELLVPIAPLEEQYRIVAKVNELMALCDQLEQQTEASIEAHQVLVTTLLDTLTDSADADELMQNWARISEHFDTLFTTEESIDQLKQTILQLAVMGKLVPQDLNDEPASELLKRIAEEKAQLIKEKKIKKQKALPPISEDEKPFKLPSGWEWCRLPDLGELARGKSKHRPRNDPKLYENGNIPLVQTGDVARANGTILTYTAKYNEFGLAQSQLWPKGTLCITIAANIADTATLGFDACFPDSVVGYTPYDKEIPTVYFDYFIKTAKENLERFAPSTAQKNINLEILSNVLVPCPPMQQFPRIVEKVNLLLGICDELKERLKESQMSQLQLTDAIVEQAV
ncbi:restriction endonuclease subunit S [Vibrio parahaemolyticus]|uniref:restriction endonuclease subunit S n=1 Tax=Vibrio parahaemolyticus TaxID=670 RepID=UPI00084A4288|nr:restriction endonuclease subunit S [Vibrio parahaemolyticus]EHR0227583.1 restriction endonuclease subunit S [Vibrio parahaemolyticus]EHZ2572914.1 restriction endonuclease subunit S [Vibrio parahaemolyticus]EHZ2575707.1 restriction endonuclease subunit S [Vibrio parahaemolyticus]EIU7734973.1 restriction endonuclease subunit S [Vibrio parahaemolyticus]EIZ1447341.1 restriction endonuclease subunit S [Vibrio parahaemolyticus]